MRALRNDSDAFNKLDSVRKVLVTYNLFGGSGGFKAGLFVEALQEVIEKYGEDDIDDAVDGTTFLLEYVQQLEEVPLAAIYERLLKGLPVKESQREALTEAYCDDFELDVERWGEEDDDEAEDQ